MTDPIKAQRISYSRNSKDCELEEVTFNKDLKPNQVLIKTSALALNPLDLKLRSIAYVPGKYHIGADFSGTVERVGSKAASLYQPGDKVSGISVMSPIGTYTLADARIDRINKCSDKLNAEEAAGFPSVMGTAFGLLKAAPELTPTSRVAVLGGATSVGSFVLQLLRKQHGIDTAVSINSGSSSDYVKKHGAATVIDYKSQDVVDELKKLAKKNGKFDCIFDTAGGIDVLNAHKDILKPASEGGRYLTIAGDAPPSSNYSSASSMFKLFGTLPRMAGRVMFAKRFYDLDYRFVTMPLTSGWFKEAKDAFDNQGITVPIDSVYPLKDFNKAIKYFENASAHGKVVISFDK